MTSNFAFLKDEFPALAEYGRLGEKYCYSDSNSCLIKLGMLGENLVALIHDYENVPFPGIDNACNRINNLKYDGLIDEDMCADLHTLRKIRNRASHEGYASIPDGKRFLQVTHRISQWFFGIYSATGYAYQPEPFVMPEDEPEDKPDTTPATDEQKKREDAELEKLAEQARKKARAAQTVRKKGTWKSTLTEAETRKLIDEQLRQVGWEADTENIRYSKGTRPTKGHNYAIAEYPTNSAAGDAGYADYALCVGEKIVAVVEAKAMHKDIPSVLDNQGRDYPKNIHDEDSRFLLGCWGEYKVPFSFATNGRPYLAQYQEKSGVWFQDLRKASNAPTALRGWVSPSGLIERLQADNEENDRKLAEMPFDLLTDKDGLNLRYYQINAIRAAERAVLAGQRSILLAMATGTGKTRTILGMMYRFLKTNRFKRILFLVDRTALGDQAQETFADAKLEDLMTLDNMYNIKGLEDAGIDPETRIHIATVQAMVKRILYNDGEEMPAVSDYDLIIVDEAHRGYILDREMSQDEALYRDQVDYQSKYRCVIDYFDAVKIGMTATPAKHTTEIFGNPVYQYSYRQAVVDGFLVDHDAPHILRTRLRDEGIHYKKGDKVCRYDPATGEIMDSYLLDDDVDYDVEAFNKRVIVPEFTNTVLREIADYIDPENPREAGKTLIYAVDDAHADRIVTFLKNHYGEKDVDTSAIAKITGSIAGGNKKRIKEAIRRFKNEEYPSVVVTVDLLTTGIDVPAITTLVFMRRVRSRILFEQMLGRATRLCPDIQKDHFEIFDPVGVYDSLEDVSTMKPAVADPSTTYARLLDMLDEAEDPAVIASVIDRMVAKLQRQKHKLTEKKLQYFSELAEGMTPTEFCQSVESMGIADARACLLAHRTLFEMLQEKDYPAGKPIIIDTHEDALTEHSRGYGKKVVAPEDYLEEFSRYLHTHINELAALNVICTRPGDLTRESLKSLKLTLDREGFTEQQLNSAVTATTMEEMAADIISLIRRYTIGSVLVSHEDRVKKAVQRLMKAHKFNKQEQSWLKRMEKYLLTESVLNVQTFDQDEGFKQAGGFNKLNKLFGNQLTELVTELNTYLYDDGGISA